MEELPAVLLLDGQSRGARQENIEFRRERTDAGRGFVERHRDAHVVVCLVADFAVELAEVNGKRIVGGRRSRTIAHLLDVPGPSNRERDAAPDELEESPFTASPPGGIGDSSSSSGAASRS